MPTTVTRDDQAGADATDCTDYAEAENYQTNPFARRASPTFQAQGSKFGTPAAPRENDFYQTNPFRQTNPMQTTKRRRTQRSMQASRLQWDGVGNRVGGHRPPLQSEGFYQTNPFWRR